MKELISIIIAAILFGTAGVSHFSCDVQGCTIEGEHEHSYCDEQGCTIGGEHEHSHGGSGHNSGHSGHHSGNSRGHH